MICNFYSLSTEGIEEAREVHKSATKIDFYFYTMEEMETLLRRRTLVDAYYFMIETYNYDSKCSIELKAEKIVCSLTKI